MTIHKTIDDYAQMRSAIFTATQYLEMARTELSSAEAFARTGLEGQTRDDVIQQVRLAFASAFNASTHLGRARLFSVHE